MARFNKVQKAAQALIEQIEANFGSQLEYQVAELKKALSEHDTHSDTEWDLEDKLQELVMELEEDNQNPIRRRRLQSQLDKVETAIDVVGAL